MITCEPRFEGLRPVCGQDPPAGGGPGDGAALVTVVDRLHGMRGVGLSQDGRGPAAAYPVTQ